MTVVPILLIIFEVFVASCEVYWLFFELTLLRCVAVLLPMIDDLLRVLLLDESTFGVDLFVLFC